jgi:threonine/homoserine/homoserine lactone efflux protein
VLGGTGIYVIFLGYALGLSLAAPPGPVNAVITNESQKSVLHGARVGAGAMTADFVFLVLLYYGRVAIPPWAYKYLYIFGAFFLIYLAFSIARSRMPSKSRTGNYFVGFSMGITNPFQILWWVTVGLFMIERLSYLSVSGFFLGIVTWIIVYPTAINRIGKNYQAPLKIFSVIVLIIFSIIMFYEASMQFL